MPMVQCNKLQKEQMSYLAYIILIITFIIQSIVSFISNKYLFIGTMNGKGARKKQKRFFYKTIIK